MMSIKALDLSEQIKYVSKLDKGDNPTVFYLGVLDTRIRKQIEDISLEYEFDPSAPSSAKAKSSFNIGKSELEFVAFGLKNFDNFLDSSGKSIQFKTEAKIVGNRQYHIAADDIIRIIPGDIVKELAEEIRRINSVGEEERKN